jgi:hypothetical protein
MEGAGNLVPVPGEPPESTCAHCGAALVADQRYCLSCGQPSSPVRLAFLDVLQGEQRASTTAPLALATDTIELGPGGYTAVPQHGVHAWLRRNSGLLGLLSVLVLCLIAGLLVGHWASQGKSSAGPQVVKVEGLGAAPAAAAAPTTSKPSESSSVQTKSSAKEEAEAAKEAAKETKAEKAPPPPPKKVTKEKLKKLTTSTGKKHQEEINALGAQPIETG